MLIVRNRLIALLCRLIMLAGLLTIFIFYFVELSPAWRALCFFEMQAGIAYMVFLFLEVIFNLIDLRRGVRGVAAGGPLQAMMLVTGYCLLSSFLYFGYIVPVHGTLTLRSMIYHAVLIAVPTLNWLLFEIKGSVRYYYMFLSVSYPLIYAIFSMFRAVIWPNAPLFTPDEMYIYRFLSPQDPAFPWAIFVSAFVVIGFFGLLLFINNLAAKKFEKKMPYLR